MADEKEQVKKPEPKKFAPKVLSEIPKEKRLAVKTQHSGPAGTVRVITTDGQKFHVKDDETSPSKPAAK